MTGEGARAHRHRPLRDRRLGVRPEARPRRATTPTGATKPAFATRRIPVAQRGQRPRRDDHQRRGRHRHRASDPRTARATSASRSRTTRPPRCACRPPSRRSTTSASARPSTTPSTATGIVKALFRGLGEPAAQLIPAGVVGYNDRPAAVAARPRQGQATGRRGEGRRRARRHARSASSAAPPSSRRSAETIEVIQSELAEIGLNVKIEMMDTAGQLQYQLRPFPRGRRPATC